MLFIDDADIRRWARNVAWPDSTRIENQTIFGSAHRGGTHFAFCDESVRTISYTIDARVHQLMGNRHSGEPVPHDAF